MYRILMSLFFLLVLSSCGTTVGKDFKFDSNEKVGLVAVTGFGHKAVDTSSLTFSNVDVKAGKFLKNVTGCQSCKMNKQYNYSGEWREFVIVALDPGMYAFLGYEGRERIPGVVTITKYNLCKGSPVIEVRAGQLSVLDIRSYAQLDMPLFIENIRKASQITAPIREASIVSKIRYSCSEKDPRYFKLAGKL